ncbi:type III secretion protein Q [Biostraticola tofi]|uniref:Surface presentation of antigens protein SpaO n=2 Tax=Biostraticola tofi TaxID=466109 RepID=A0A4R3YXT2_9GAMM|nr:type III secretion protein Q [Biostraticola tofi]
MSQLMLRTVTPAEIILRQFKDKWGNDPGQCRLANPDSCRRHHQVTADDGAWLGMIDLREWFSYHAPELAVMASHACSDEKIISLFNVVERPLTFEMGGLPYRTLQLSAVVDGPRPEHLGQMLLVTAAECRVWIFDIDLSLAGSEPTVNSAALDLPVMVEFMIGTSILSSLIPETLEAGDLLIIQQPATLIKCQGQTLGKYHHDQGRLIMKPHDDNMHSRYDVTCPEREGYSLQEPLNAIPLQVEFVLQRRFMSIADVTQLIEGSVLDIDRDAEKHIEILINGKLFAKGELVQISDRLAVEMMAVGLDAQHAK